MYSHTSPKIWDSFAPSKSGVDFVPCATPTMPSVKEYPSAYKDSDVELFLLIHSQHMIQEFFHKADDIS